MPSSSSVLWPWDFRIDISLSDWMRFRSHKRKLKRQIVVILQTLCLLFCKIHLFSMLNPFTGIFHSGTFSLAFRLLFPGINLWFTFFPFVLFETFWEFEIWLIYFHFFQPSDIFLLLFRTRLSFLSHFSFCIFLYSS